MEYLDILDKSGNKTGEKKPRKEVHSKGYWHKGVHIWIINSNRELLVQRRSSNKDVYPNKLYYKDFETMINNKDKDIVNNPEEWKRLFEILHQRYDNEK